MSWKISTDLLVTPFLSFHSLGKLHPTSREQRKLLSDWSVQSGISLVNPLKSKRGKETARFVTHR